MPAMLGEGSKKMFVFFEHHKDEHGSVLATEVVASSYKDRPGIFWRKDEIPMKLLTGLFKTPPLEQRMYDQDLKTWTYIGDAGKHLLEVVQESFEKLKVDVTFFETEDLADQIRAGKFTAAKEIDPKNFFYNRATLNATPALTKELATAKLAAIFHVSEFELSDKMAVKRLYRAKAMEFHPDRNQGDGSKMSELNMYWQVYNAS